MELPYYDEMSATLAVMMFAEAFAYHHGDMGSRWTDYYAQGRMNLARGALSLGADYVQAARVRRLAQQRLTELFRTVDLIVSPTAAIGAPTEELWSKPDLPSWIFSVIFTGYWDSSGHPALAVPMGFTADGMPLSLQIAARPFEEGLALRAGDAYQQVTDWHLQLPALLTDTLAAA